MATAFAGIPIEADRAGIAEQIIKSIIDVYEVGTETFQNGMDSAISPEMSETVVYNQLANEIDLWMSEPGKLILQDSGLSIAKDYDYDLMEFISAKKAKSKKTKLQGTAGHKGIAMYVYLKAANRIEIVSMDRDHKGLIYRFYMYWETDEDGNLFPCYTSPQSIEQEPITKESMKKFDIYKQGTRITFLELTLEGKNMQLDKIVERIREVFALRLAWNPNLIFRVNGIRQYAPDWMTKHPEISLLDNGKTSIGKRFSISGNVYKDPNGMSTLEVISRAGLKIMEYTFRNRDNPYRRCSGWVYCDKLQPDTSRRSVIKDDVWDTFESFMFTRLEEFQKVKFAEEELTSDTEKKTFDIFKKFMNKALAQILPKPIVIGGNDRKSKKTQQTGNLHPNPDDKTVAGHRPPKPPNPDREIIPRPPHPRDNTNQKQVGLDGTDSVMRK